MRPGLGLIGALALGLLGCSAARDAMATGSVMPTGGRDAGSGAAVAGSLGQAQVAGSAGRSGAAGMSAKPMTSAGAVAVASGRGGAGVGSASAGVGGVVSGEVAGVGALAAGAGGSAGDSAAGMGGAAAVDEAFVLTPVGFPMAGNELTFPETANPPTNQSPEFTWTGVPPEAQSLALAFRDLGNGAVKWVIWDMPPSQMHIPPNIMPVAMPSEVAGSSQLGSLSNQGYAGPGSGARQYDFTLWALDTEALPVTPRMTTVQIHELLEMHELEKTPPVLVRNTRNL